MPERPGCPWEWDLPSAPKLPRFFEDHKPPVTSSRRTRGLAPSWVSSPTLRIQTLRETPNVPAPSGSSLAGHRSEHTWPSSKKRCRRLVAICSYLLGGAAQHHVSSFQVGYETKSNVIQHIRKPRISHLLQRCMGCMGAYWSFLSLTLMVS